MIDLVGAWSLHSSINYRDGVGTPSFGDPPSGQLQYSREGRMSGFLMNPEWPGRPTAEADPFDEFFAYAGRWRRAGDQVTHWVDFCSVATKVGTQFVRTVNVISDTRIELVTAPETSKSGRVYVTRLIWDRVVPDGPLTI
jgi:hypothetical protein